MGFLTKANHVTPNTPTNNSLSSFIANTPGIISHSPRPGREKVHFGVWERQRGGGPGRRYGEERSREREGMVGYVRGKNLVGVVGMGRES